MSAFEEDSVTYTDDWRKHFPFFKTDELDFEATVAIIYNLDEFVTEDL